MERCRIFETDRQTHSQANFLPIISLFCQWKCNHELCFKLKRSQMFCLWFYVIVLLGPVHMGRGYFGYRENISRQVYKRDLALLWNNMKSCIAFIWDEKFSRVPRSRLLTGEISVTKIIFIAYEHSFPTWRENFLFILYKIYITTGNFILPSKRKNISSYEQNNIIWPVEMFSRQPR